MHQVFSSVAVSARIFVASSLLSKMTDQQKKFSLEKAVAGHKRAVETPEKPAKKIPKVSQMTPAEPRPQRVTTNAPVVICVQ